MEKITIPREEYEKLKRMAEFRLKELNEIDIDLFQQFMRSLEDIKAGRIRRVR